MSVRELRHGRPSGRFSNRGVCLQAFPPFLPQPLPALLLALFFARSLTLVPHSLLLNRTETLATQARPSMARMCKKIPKSRLSGFIVFDHLETWWNPKHEFLKLLIQQRKLVEIIILIISFLNSNTFYLRRGMWTCHLLVSCCIGAWYYFICLQTDATTLYIVGPTMLGVVVSVCTLLNRFDRFQTLRNNSQQHATSCNSACKRTQHVTSNNVASVCTGL